MVARFPIASRSVSLPFSTVLAMNTRPDAFTFSMMALVLFVGALIAEADDRQRDRSRALELRMRVHQRGKVLCVLDVRAQQGLKALAPEVAHHKPKLQRAETMAERDAVIHQVVRPRIVMGLQVVRRE